MDNLDKKSKVGGRERNDTVECKRGSSKGEGERRVLRKDRKLVQGKMRSYLVGTIERRQREEEEEF